MKIILFCKNPYAFGILKPLHDIAIPRADQVLWYVPNSLTERFPFKDQTIYTDSIRKLEEFGSDAIFVPGNEVPHYLKGLKVQIFHGLAGEKKGHFRIRHYFDLYLTQGPYFTSKFNELKVKYRNFDVIETGWPKLDILFQNHTEYKKCKNDLLEKSGKQKLILYAPTFSPSLTSASKLKDEIFKLAQTENCLILIKFHDLMNKAVINEYKETTKDYSNIEVVEDRNIIKHLIMADLMISDTSSVVYEFLLLDKPVITLNSNSDNISWLNISDPSQLLQAYMETFESDNFSDQRKEIIAQYHPYTDGNSSERMLNTVAKYIEQKGVPEYRKLRFFRKRKMNKMFGNKPK